LHVLMPPRRGWRILVLCADIGEGHVTVARALTERLEQRDDVSAVGLHTDLDVMGPRLGRFLTEQFHTHLEDTRWTYDLAYKVFFEPRLPRAGGHFALAALGGRALRRTIYDFGADVVVTEYPVLSAALGQLRALGRLAVPVCSSISDPAGLYYWAHPGIDLHLLSWPEAEAEVDRIAGPGRAAIVRPLVHSRFLAPPPRAEARAATQLPDGSTVVLISGGGWGVGDLAGAADATLRATSGDAVVVCLAGRSERVRSQLEACFAADPRVRVLGFTTQMPELLAAADALIHTTGGTTALEARIVGCPLINLGTSPAHVREHARLMAERGIAAWARDRTAIPEALARTLAAPRPAPLDVAALPDAADLVVATADGRGT
jgi:UDP-N-acetylglucosamine:LPS N-acetylglucosamine transferase